jgi:hypothetical protein
MALTPTSAGTWKQFETLRPYLTSVEPEISYEQAARELEMTPGAVRTALHRMRKRLGRCLRAEVEATVATPDEVDDEMRHLLATVRAGSDIG